jgi:hypothetical protein
VSLLVATQEQYGLSDIYLYRSGTGLSAICLRTFPLRRLEKIIRASGSANFGTLAKYRQLFFRVGDIRDEDQNLTTGPPEYVKTLPAPEENNARFVSRPHYDFIKDFIPVLQEYPRMHGKGAVLLTHTVNEE